MRILHVLHLSMPFVCGYSIRSEQIVSRQRGGGHDIAVVTSAQQPDRAGEEVRAGIPHHRTPYGVLPPTPLREIKLMDQLTRRIAEIVDQACPDLIHAHSPILVGIPAYRVARREGLPFVYEIRDLWENASVDRGKFKVNSLPYRVARAAETWLVRKADGVVTICEALRDELNSRVDRDIDIVFNGVDPSAFQPAPPAETWSATWNPDGRRLLAYIGSFQPYEGLEVLIQAFRLVLDSNSNVGLLIAGDGPERPGLERLARSLGIADRVNFTGRIPHDKVREIYSVADILVYPRIATRTTQLTTPLKTLEALAMGKAVITSDLAPARELVVENETGCFFRPGDPNSLANQIRMLLDDRERCVMMGKAGREWVRQHRSWDRAISIYDQVYAKAKSGCEAVT